MKTQKLEEEVKNRMIVHCKHLDQKFIEINNEVMKRMNEYQKKIDREYEIELFNFQSIQGYKLDLTKQMK